MNTAIPVAATAPPRRNSLPSWLPYFALAAVPALIVGTIVYALASNEESGGGGGNVSAVMDGFIRIGNEPENVITYVDALPPEFPAAFPVYRGASTDVSFSILDPQSNSVSFFAIFITRDSPESVYDFYLQSLREDPWQVEFAQSSEELTRVVFSNPEDAEVSGQLTAHFSDLDRRTVIYLTYEDLSPTDRPLPAERDFDLGMSRPLPPNFPNDLPIYEGGSDSVVQETVFERAPGASSYYISFLTEDGQADVIEFYRTEFQRRGWTVTDTQSTGQQFALGIDFSEGQNQTLQGTITADSSEDNAAYTQVNIFVQVSSSRGRGN
jgi:hypothetical protein